MRIYEIFIALLCLFFGGLVSLTSFGMTVSMLISPVARTEVTFWVGLVGLLIAPTIFIAGIRLLINKPNKYGGLFSPNLLRIMATIYGITGGAILILALREKDVTGIYGGISFLITTQGAFVLANRRAKT